MSDASEYSEAVWRPPQDAAGPWTLAFRTLVALIWAWRLRIAAAAFAFALLAMVIKFLFPGGYSATAQILFDPEGVKLFASDVVAGRAEANSQINFVESQMGVILSERVLERVLARECSGDAGGHGGESAPPSDFLKLCAGLGKGADGASAKSIDGLRKLLQVKRAERSYLVDVIAHASSPKFAAGLAKSTVEAYIAEDSGARAALSNRMAGELDARLDAIKRAIAESEAKSEIFRKDKNLLQVGDHLLVERKLIDATAALNAAETQLERARARVDQMDTTPKSSADIGELGEDADARSLALLLDRRAAVEAELAPLATRLGARNPSLVEARSKAERVNREVAAAARAIRASARALLGRAQRERDNLARLVAALASQLTSAREAQIALQTLETSTAANRKVAETLETRAREIAEMGRVNVANLRIASQAQAPEARVMTISVGLWGVAGFVLGLMLTLSAVAFIAIWRTETSSARKTPTEELAAALADELSDVAHAMRAARAHARI